MAAQKKSDKPFLSDIATIRKRARAHMERGAVTDSYTLDRDVVLKLLNEALATEIVCVLRYKAHYYLASGINAKSVAAEFLEHANEEQGHADQIAERITQLDGTPNFSPDGLTARSHAEFVTPKTFDAYAQIARAKGFLQVASSPLTRSSYHAGDDFERMRAAREAQLARVRAD